MKLGRIVLMAALSGLAVGFIIALLYVVLR